MRIVAQTEVPVNPSFMHLAYVSATQPNGFGSASILILGIVAYYFIQKKKWPWKVGLLALVIAASAVWLQYAPVHYQYPAWVSESRAEEIRIAVDDLRYHGKPVPQDLDQLELKSGARFESKRDAWGHRYRITRSGTGRDVDYRIVSAGKDGKFGTSDDLRFPRERGAP